MLSLYLKLRSFMVATLLGTAILASANTPMPWSNPLLRYVPAAAKAFLSIDLAGTNHALVTVLKLAEIGGGSSINQVAASGLGMLHLPKPLQDEFAKDWNRRAVAYYNPAGAGRPMANAVVMVLGLKSAPDMAAALLGGAQSDSGGIAYTDFKGVVARIEGDTLLLSLDARNLGEAVKPYRGGLHLNFANLRHVSESIESTAEVIGWTDSNTAISAAPASNLLLKTGQSFGFSLGLHPHGVSLAVGPLQFGVGGTPLDFSQFRPLPERLLHTLPGGAYLLTCLANPWPIADRMNLTSRAPKNVRRMMQRVQNAVRGDYVLGVYPTRLVRGNPEGVDLLMELRPTEGNDPAESLNRLMSAVKRAFLPGDVSAFEPIHISGADRAYRLNAVIASLLRAALKLSMGAVGGGADPLLREKNLTFAAVGSNILVATSEPVLRKAVEALKFGSSALAYDPKFGELAQDSVHPTQFILALSLTRSLTFVTKMLSTLGAKAGAKSLASVTAPLAMISGFMVSWPDPLMLRVSVQHAGISARLYIPVNFDILAQLAQGRN
ncbi:MAG: hypothetical protein ACYC96_12640 [Fimbriimonadaceae bacterium]